MVTKQIIRKQAAIMVIYAENMQKDVDDSSARRVVASTDAVREVNQKPSSIDKALQRKAGIRAYNELSVNGNIFSTHA